MINRAINFVKWNQIDKKRMTSKSFIFLYVVSIFSGYAECDSSLKFITNTPGSDGFGSQFQEIIATVIYAELHNKQFVYTPFKAMEHNYNNDADFIIKKEQFINFIDNFETIDKIARHEQDVVTSDIAYKAFFDANVVACANSFSLKKVKKFFRENKNTNNYFNNNNLNIAIHVRRPNPHDNRILGTDTPDNFFLRIVNQLRVIYVAENPLFHLYSQGNNENFDLFKADDLVLHLDESIEDTFLGMVLAEVLVTGASSFSYTAGLLSDGVVYYMPFWHEPLPHWISIKTLVEG